MSDNLREIPRGARGINDQELERVVYEVVDSLPKETDGSISTTIEDVESNLYDMISPKLKSKRIYYPGLNPRVLSRMLKSVSTSFTFKVITSSPKDLMVEYDQLVWNKVNEIPYNSTRLETLRRTLKIGKDLL